MSEAGARIRATIACPRGCGMVFGETDGRALYLIACSITRLVTLHCTRPGCGGRRVWQPAPKGATADALEVHAPR